ncbi:MAG: helix-turn-helix domain-containing protein [Gammaproteobacteria bacterium]
MADDTDCEQDKDVSNKHFAGIPTPGEMLRKAREEKNLNTKEIAATMNVDPWMLDALEHDEYSALGAPVFAKGHLKKYATALGLDEGDVMVSYYQLDGTREAPPLVAESMLRVESTKGARLNWLAPAAGVLTLAIIAVVLFLYFQPNDSAESARAATVVMEEAPTTTADERTLRLPLSRNEVPVPATVVTQPKPDPVPEAVSEALSGNGENSAPKAPSAAPSVIEIEPEPEPVPEPVSAPPAQPTVAAAEPRGTLSTTLSTPGEVRVTLSFEGESWVEVYDANRAKLLYDMGQSGTRRSVSGPGPLQVFLGKASDVEVSVNGRPYDVRRVSRLGTARFYVDAKTR